MQTTNIESRSISHILDISCNNITRWPEDTVLVTGDSNVEDMKGKELSHQYNVEVRAYPGACIDDMYDYVKPLLRRKPKYVILHIGSNDSSDKNKTADIILQELLNLKHFIETMATGITVIISCPILRLKNEVVNSKIIQVRDRLKSDNVTHISNENITFDDGIGSRASYRLKMNINAFIRNLPNQT